MLNETKSLEHVFNFPKYALLPRSDLINDAVVEQAHSHKVLGTHLQNIFRWNVNTDYLHSEARKRIYCCACCLRIVCIENSYDSLQSNN